MAADGASGVVGGALGWKLIGGLAGLGAIGSGLAALVVMCLRRPKDHAEWVVALVATFMSSIGGGSAFVQWQHLQHWAQEPFGVAALFGLAFAAGLPGWFLVRSVFVFMAKREGKGIDEVVKDIRP